MIENFTNVRLEIGNNTTTDSLRSVRKYAKYENLYKRLKLSFSSLALPIWLYLIALSGSVVSFG